MKINKISFLAGLFSSFAAIFVMNNYSTYFDMFLIFANIGLSLLNFWFAFDNEPER